MGELPVGTPSHLPTCSCSYSSFVENEITRLHMRAKMLEEQLVARAITTIASASISKETMTVFDKIRDDAQSKRIASLEKEVAKLRMELLHVGIPKGVDAWD